MTDSDRSQGPAWKWRPDIQGTVDAVYEEYGEEHGHPGIVPYEIVEAYIEHESQGVPDAINPTPMSNGQHATGLMQIVPGLSITGVWSDYSGEGVTQEQLLDPQTNLRVGIAGLADRALDIQRTGGFGYDFEGNRQRDTGKEMGPDWPTTVTIGMWGAGYMDGYGFWQPNWEVTDGPSGETGAGMRQFLFDYVQGFDDPAVSKAVNLGQWRAGDDPERKKFVPYNNAYSVFPWVEGAYDGAKAIIGDAKDAVADQVIAGIAGALNDAMPRIAMIGAGIALLAGGLIMIRTMAMKTAVGL